MNVFLLYHVHHRYVVDGQIRHRDESGVLTWNEDYGDDVKLLGVHSTRERALERASRARELPGFRDEPDCFHVDRYELDKDEWTTGYATSQWRPRPSRDSNAPYADPDGRAWSAGAGREILTGAHRRLPHLRP